jgi:hypothetical protein
MKYIRYILVVGWILFGTLEVKSENYSLGLESKSEVDVVVYPNPVTNANVTITSEKEIQKIDILNILGEQILSQKPIPSNSIKLVFDDLKSGIYIIKITFTDNTSSAKRIWVK